MQYVPRLFTFCRLIPSQRTTVWAGTILFALVVLSADMVRAAGSKCTAAKYNAAGQRVADEAKCFGKAVKKGGGVDSACLLKAEGMFASLFMKAESHADCLAPKGDAGTVAATVDAFVEDIGRTVTGSAGGRSSRASATRRRSRRSARRRAPRPSASRRRRGREPPSPRAA